MNKTKPEPHEKDREEDSLFSRLLKTRTIIVSDEIDKKMAQRVISQLLMLEQEDPKKSIKLFINSPGGDADAGFAIFDMVRFIKPEVKTICTGLTASAAVIILLGAEKKNRYSLTNARILIHQPSTGIMGTAADIEIEASEILKFRDKINLLIAKETGQSIKKIEDDTRRNFWMSGEEALKYGLISKIVKDREQLG
ncbi:MAG: ClpP family protease [Candidatus Bathyanammoxibius sp.]